MAVEDAIYTRLSGYGGLTTLVQDRIYAEKADGSQPAFPYVTFESVGTLEPYHTFSLPAAFDVTDQHRFHVWGRSNESGTVSGQKSAADVAMQVRLAMHDHSDATIQASIFASEATIGEDSEGIYHRVLDFEITHTVATS